MRKTNAAGCYRSLIFLVGIGLLLGQPDLSSAQVLNQKVNDLLANNCAALGPFTLVSVPGGGPLNAAPAGFGINLARLCQTPTTTTAVTAGGGAASVQGSAVSFLNRALFQRLDETDEEACQSRDETDKKKCQNHKRSSSLTFNPMGMLMGGFGSNLSVNSPFYASTTANGGSAALLAAN